MKEHLCVNPGSHSELMDEHFCSLCKKHRSLSRDHLGGFDEKMLLAPGQLQQKTTHFHILIQLHYLLYPDQLIGGTRPKTKEKRQKKCFEKPLNPE